MNFTNACVCLVLLLVCGKNPTILSQDPIVEYGKAKLSQALYNGVWIRTEPDTVELEIIHLSDGVFEFRLTSFNPNYAGYIGEGRYTNKKSASVIGTTAIFNDSAGICDGRSLYYEDEEPCKLQFVLVNDQTLHIEEADCMLIYGGDGVTWRGEYRRREHIETFLCDNLN